MRIYTMLAKMARTRKEQHEFLLVAQYYVVRMWEMCSAAINAVHAATASDAGAAENAALIVLPVTIDDWIRFKLPAHFWENCNTQPAATPTTEKGTAQVVGTANAHLMQTFSSLSLLRPVLTVVYLQYLAKSLAEFELDLYACAVHPLIHLLCERLLKDAPQTRLCLLRWARLMRNLGQSENAAALLKSSGELRLSPAERKAVREEAVQREQLKKLMPNESRSRSAPAPTPSEMTILRPITKHEVWIEHASELLQLGLFDFAKERLSEAVVLAKAFEDNAAEAWCLHYLAAIAALEGDLTAAVRGATSAHRLGTLPIELWGQSMLALASYYERTPSQFDVAVATLEKFIRALAAKALQCPQLTMLYGVWEARAHLHLARMLLRAAERTLRITYRTPDAQAALADPMWAQSSEELELAHTLAVKFADTLLLTDVLETIAHREPLPRVADVASAQRAQLRATHSLARAVMLATTAFNSAKSPTIDRSVDLAAARRLVRLKLRLSEAQAALAYEELSFPGKLKDKIPVPDVPLAGGSADDLAVVKEFVDRNNDTSYVHDVSLAENAVLHATDAVTLVPSSPVGSRARAALARARFLFAEVQYGMLGRLWRTRAQLVDHAEKLGIQALMVSAGLITGVDDPAWVRMSAPEARLLLERAQDSAGSTAAVVVPTADETSQAAALPFSRSSAPFLAEALDALEAAKVELHLEKRWAELGSVAWDIAHGWARDDRSKSAAHLLLWQSCRNQQITYEWWRLGVATKHTEAALLSLIDYVEANDSLSLQNESYQRSLAALYTTSPMFRRVSPPLDHAALIAKLPPKLLVLSLMYDASRSAIYFVVLNSGTPLAAEKPDPKAAKSAAADAAPTPPQPPIVERLPVAAGQVEELVRAIGEFRRHKTELVADPSVVNHERQVRAASEDAEAALARSTEEINNEMLAEIVASMRALLEPMCALLDRLCLVSEGGVDRLKSLVMLVDDRLAPLPLELLRFCSHFIAVSRDVSLAVLMHRLSVLGEAPTAEKCIKKTNVGYIIDARNEASLALPAEVNIDFKEAWAAVQELQAGQGVSGWHHIASTAEIEQHMRQCAFVYHGFGKFATALPIADLYGLDLSTCHLAMLLDQHDIDATIRRQSKVDSLLQPEIIQLHAPVEMATMCSARGVNAVVVNQWQTTAADNQQVLSAVFTAMRAGKSVGEAITTWKRTKSGATSHICPILYGLPNLLLE